MSLSKELAIIAAVGWLIVMVIATMIGATMIDTFFGIIYAVMVSLVVFIIVRVIHIISTGQQYEYFYPKEPYSYDKGFLG